MSWNANHCLDLSFVTGPTKAIAIGATCTQQGCWSTRHFSPSTPAGIKAHLTRPHFIQSHGTIVCRDARPHEAFELAPLPMSSCILPGHSADSAPIITTVSHMTEQDHQHASRLHPVGDAGAKDTLGPARLLGSKTALQDFVSSSLHRACSAQGCQTKGPFEPAPRNMLPSHAIKLTTAIQRPFPSMVPAPLSSASRMATAQLLVIFTLLPDALVSITCGHKTDLFRSISPGCSKPTNSLPAKWLNPTTGSNTHQDPALSYSDHPMSSMRPCCILKNASCSINVSLLQSCC